jgi:uroporphyrinogen decarboxylase
MDNAFPPLQNDLFLKVLRGEAVPRPPVWLMRQAGRYLPDYRVLRDKYSFWQRCENPELVAEISTMPVEQIGVDAAIVFSDILVVARALGFDVTINEGEGPRVLNPVRSPADVARLTVPDVRDRLSYVMQGLTATRHALGGKVPLIGFAGAPWTILCYLVEGQGSPNFYKAKEFCFQHPAAAEQLLEVIAETTLQYLLAQAEAGAQAVQVFDSWAGLLSFSDFQQFSLPYIEHIVKGVKSKVPVIIFAKGVWHSLDRLSESGAACLGLDWTVSATRARYLVGNNNMALQGNLDPARLLSPPDEVVRRTRKMVGNFGNQRYIANLGHGVLPNTPVEHVKLFVQTVKDSGSGK